LLAALVIFIGCSGSAPRFKGAQRASDRDESSEHRFAAKIRREEAAEDDRKVDIDEVRERYSSHGTPWNGSVSPIDRKRVMAEVLAALGTPYALGGNSEEGMDCSAFTGHVFRQAADRTLPRSTHDQYKLGRGVGKGRLQFGDLVFFNTTGQSPSHVGLFIGDDLFAHASVSYGVTISSLQSSYYRKRYIGARRIVE
jgi:hypothetical protein